MNPTLKTKFGSCCAYSQKLPLFFIIIIINSETCVQKTYSSRKTRNLSKLRLSTLGYVRKVWEVNGWQKKKYSLVKQCWGACKITRLHLLKYSSIMIILQSEWPSLNASYCKTYQKCTKPSKMRLSSIGKSTQVSYKVFWR
jgi:hypothetical protein